jgi:hypothetical protein
MQPSQQTAKAGPRSGTSSVVQEQAKQLRESYLRVLEQAPGGKNSAHSSQKPKAVALAPVGPAQTAVVISGGTQEASALEVSAATQHRAQSFSDVPDILSGFDSALKQQEQRTSVGTADLGILQQQLNELQYSPPFTSRSFDDFHRLLGKDLTPLDDTARPGPTNTEAGKGAVVALSASNSAALAPSANDATALFTAESYALFAQESAREACQHAAYLPPQLIVSSGSMDLIPPLSEYMGHGNVDSTSGTINPVSEHTYDHDLLEAVLTNQHAFSNGKASSAEPKAVQDGGAGRRTVHETDATTSLRGLTPVERFMVSKSISPFAHVVSEASGSVYGTTSDNTSSLENTSCDSADDTNSDSNSVENGLQRKKQKIKRDQGGRGGGTDPVATQISMGQNNERS